RLTTPYPERAVHAADLVVGDAAPVRESPMPEPKHLRRSRSGQGLADRVDVRAPDAPELEVVCVLAEVRELDRHASGGNPRAGEGKAKLVRDGLEARRKGPRFGRLSLPRAREDEGAHGNEEAQRRDCEVPAGTHFRIAGCSKLAAFGMIAAESVSNHCSRREQ